MTKQSISVTYSGAALANYPIVLIIDTATPIAKGQMQPDGRDIRFLDSDGVTNLQYYIAYQINSAYTQIWINVPSITGNKTIYITYGDSTLSAASSFNNTFLPPLVLLQADKITGLSDGSSVTTWNDQSGNGNNATATVKPIYHINVMNNLPSVQGDGVSEVMNLSIGSQFGSNTGTVIVATKLNGQTQYGLMHFGTAGLDEYTRYSVNGGSYPGEFRNVRIEDNPASMPTTGTHIMSYKSGTSYTYTEDGVQRLSTTTSWGIDATPKLFFQGTNSGYFSGWISEVIVFNSAISAQTQRLLELYLSYKYGIAYTNSFTEPTTYINPTSINTSGWKYRRKITINGSAAGAQTNYQIKISLSSTDIIGKSDFSDIRFTKSDGTSQLYFYIESVISGTAIVWVKVDSIPASPGTATIYIYYGNSSASSVSSGVNTFIVFNDFSLGFIDQAWAQYSLNPAQTAVISTDFSGWSQKIDTTYSLKCIGCGSTFPPCDSGLSITIRVTNIKILWDTKITANVTSQVLMGSPIVDNATTCGFTGTVINHESSLISVATPYTLTIRTGQCVAGASITSYIDTIRGRSFVSPEPSFSSLGNQELVIVLTTILGSLYTPVGRGITPPTGAALGRKRLRSNRQ